MAETRDRQPDEGRREIAIRHRHEHEPGMRRDENDRGVLMICDPRLITKHYGKRIWRSLPPMRRTRDVADVLNFYRKIADAAA